MGTLSERLADIGYPIGWKIPPGPYLLPRPAPQACKPDGLAPNGCRYEMGPAKWLMALIGWLITALAIMLGAPFWFDVLNKFMVIRSTVKPNEKSRPEASEDRQTDGKRALRVELVQKPA
jgi:hypothetical protein